MGRLAAIRRLLILRNPEHNSFRFRNRLLQIQKEARFLRLSSLRCRRPRHFEDMQEATYSHSGYQFIHTRIGKYICLQHQHN